MTDYKSNPEEALKEFDNLVGKISASVSSTDIANAIPVMNTPYEWTPYNNNLLRERLDVKIKEVYNSIMLVEKLRELKKLEDNADSQPAWRPKTGTALPNALKAKNLLYIKRNLLGRIDRTKMESLQIQKDVAERRAVIKQQIEDMNSIDLSKLFIKSHLDSCNLIPGNTQIANLLH